MANEKQRVTANEILGEVREAIRDCFVGRTEEKEGKIRLTLTGGQVFTVCVSEENSVVS